MSTSFTQNRPLVMASIMAAMFMTAVEATVVSTAMPHIAHALGNLSLYSWVFAAYMLAQTSTAVIFGKLADHFGRVRVLCIGMALFGLGSLLCGLSSSMMMLIIFRFIQGLGAGAILPVCMTVIGDLYPLHERGKAQALGASVFGISSLVGPLLGVVIVEHLPWAYIFWINIPVGAIALVGFLLYLKDCTAENDASLDVAGAHLLASTVIAFSLAMTWAGLSSISAALWAAGAALALLLLLIGQERRAADPIVDIALWRRKAILSANCVTMLAGMMAIGVTAFLPLYVQSVMRQAPIIAGLAVTAMAFGWPLGATLTSRLLKIIGFRSTMILGAWLLPSGALLYLCLGPDASPVLAAAGSALTGLGMGFVTTTSLNTVQESVSGRQKGAVTGSNIFARNLGSTIGSSLFGAILNASIVAAGGREFARTEFNLSDIASQAHLAQGLHMVFLAMFAIGLVNALIATFISTEPLRPAEAAS